MPAESTHRSSKAQKKRTSKPRHRNSNIVIIAIIVIMVIVVIIALIIIIVRIVRIILHPTILKDTGKEMKVETTILRLYGPFMTYLTVLSE